MRNVIWCLLACVVFASGCCTSNAGDTAGSRPAHRPTSAPTTQPSSPDARRSGHATGDAVLLASTAGDAAATTEPATQQTEAPILEVKSARYGSGENWV